MRAFGGCPLPNLFTLHNDWRDMGAALRIVNLILFSFYIIDKSPII